MATAEELLTQMVATAHEQLRWTRAAAIGNAKRTIEETLTTTTQRKCYEALDGTRSGHEAAQASGASNGSVSGWARRWRELGIAYEYAPESGRTRTKHLVSLEDLGIPVEIDESGS